MTTEIEMRQAIESRLRQQPNFKQSGNWINCNSPIREEKNASFGYDMNGGYNDLGSGESGTAFELAEKLGIPTPEAGSSKIVTINKKNLDAEYKDLDDYAKTHFEVDPLVLRQAGWKDGKRKSSDGIERNVIIIPTHRGKEERYRFLSGSQKYGHRPGYPLALYGLYPAIKIASNPNCKIDGLIICNGEGSTVIGQHYGLPVFCKTSGEAKLPDNLLSELKSQWKGKLYIALDCDERGRNAAKDIQAQWENSIIIDLSLHDKGDVADFCKLHKDNTIKEFNKLIDLSDGYRGTRSDVSMRGFINFLYDENPKPSTGIPLEWPFKSFHQYGGMFDMCMPKKIIGIVSGSGDGKTAFAESIADCILRDGGDVCWFGKEWGEDEMAQRRVARYGGLSITDIAKFKRYKEDWARGVPEHQRKGFKPTDEQIEKSSQIAASCARWPGHSYHMPHHNYVEDLLDDMTHNVVKARGEGRAMMLAIFDYVQLLNTRDKVFSEAYKYELIMGKIKDWVEINSMVAIVVSQVTKGSQHEANHKNGRTLSKEDAQFIRSDKFNGILTLNFDYYEKDGELVKVEQNGYVMIQKNSGGQAPRRVKMYSRLDLHGWFDPLDSIK